MIVYTLNTHDAGGNFSSEVFTCGLTALSSFDSRVRRKFNEFKSAHGIDPRAKPDDYEFLGALASAFRYHPWDETRGDAGFHLTGVTSDIWLRRVHITERPA